jgi:hypothetical protein
MAKRKYLQPWWVTQRWAVKAVAVRDASDGSFRRGDWIEIYSASTKSEAQRLAKEWSLKMSTPTTVEPGAGHKARRGF